MKIKHMNQLEIAQNEIWIPRNFPLYGSVVYRHIYEEFKVREGISGQTFTSS